ncbi:EF-hand calcium-binding domain-containing protein 13 [Rhineura floridana]|uniref:EF-hand calcium-binding domain-containing protein 13 n=1 Tax=Rhineura floridana TaxID=261503 RepID=UPI002AC86ED6|nr:EF-hand calcium-binding domain-containing protein 13 [Rhineura floridana]
MLHFTLAPQNVCCYRVFYAPSEERYPPIISTSQDLNEQAEDSKSQDPNEQSEGDSKSQDLIEQSEGDRKSQDLTEQSEGDSKSQDLTEQSEGDSKSQDLTEQSEGDSKSQDLTEQSEGDSKSQDLTEQSKGDSKSQDLNEQSGESKFQDEKDQYEEGLETSEQQPQEGKEHSQTRSSSSREKSIADLKDDLSSFLATEPRTSARFSSRSFDSKFRVLKETDLVESQPEISELQCKHKEGLPFFWKTREEEWMDEIVPTCHVAKHKLSYHDCCGYSAAEQLIKHSPMHLAKGSRHRGFFQKRPKFKRSKISSSTERMLKAGVKRKKECRAFANIQPRRTTSSGSCRYLGRKSKALYNLYTTFCDEEEQFDPCLLQRAKGLFRACTIFSTIKKGKINISNLLLTTHTLGILLTNAEMHQALKFIPMDAHGNLDFVDFLDVLKDTLAYNKREALQNALFVFRNIRKDMVAIDELEPILACLGVTLSPNIVEQAVGCTRVTWDGKINISEFLSIVRGPSSRYKELDECATLERGSYQSFANIMGDLETRWRRNWSLLDKEISPAHAHLAMFYDPDVEVALAQLQKRTSKSQRPVDQRRPSTASPECHVEEKGTKWPRVRPTFGYTSQDTLFPLSSSLSFKEWGRPSAQQTKTRKSSMSAGQDDVPFSLVKMSANYEAIQQHKKKKILSFQEKLPRRYDSEENCQKSNSESEIKEHPEVQSAQQGPGLCYLYLHITCSFAPNESLFSALQNAFDIINMLAEDNIKSSELRSTLYKMGVSLNDKEFQEVLQKAGMAEDGMVNFDSFMSALGKTQCFTEFTMLKDAIQAISKIERDKVVVHNLPSFVRDMGICLSDQEFKQALKQVSVDGNGKVVVKDFIKVLTDIPHFSELSVLKATITAVNNIQGNKVSLQNLKPTLKKMGIRLNPQEYEELITMTPADKAGKVDIGQVMKKVSKIRRFSEMEVLNNAIKTFSHFKDEKVKVSDVEVCLRNIGVHLTKSELMQTTKSLPVSSDGTVDVKELTAAMKSTRRFANYAAVLDTVHALKLIKEHHVVESQAVKGSINRFGLRMANEVIAQVLKSVHMTEAGQARFNDFLRTLTRNQQFRTSVALGDGFVILTKLENGRIGVDELQEVMKSFNINLPLKEVSEALACCSIDDKNTVNLKDFISGVTYTSTFITCPELQLTCMALSKLKGDHFDLHALESILNTMDLPEANELLQEVMKTAQADSHGKVNFKEFMRVYTVIPELPEAIVLKDTFDAMSNIRDARIHVDDLPKTLASVGINLTPEELRLLHNSVAVAGDETVGFKDIIMSITGTESFTEFNALQNAFNAINKICKEKIKKEDLPAALEDLGIQLSADELQAALASISIDDLGKVDGTEFLKILCNAPRFSEFIALRDAMKVVESIKNKKMTVKQLEETLGDMGVHLPNTTFNEIVKSAKADVNGKINFKDFLLALGETEDFTELEALQRAITIIGTMHGGRLQLNELQSTLDNLGIHLKHEEFQEVASALHVDDDGTVNLKDCLTAVSNKQRFLESVALHSAVGAFSKIKSEKVAIRELESILECLGITLSSTEFQSALKTIPADENGKVNFKDFLTSVINNERFSEPAAVQNVYSIISKVDDDKVEVSRLKDVLAPIGITLTKDETKEVLKNMAVDSDGMVKLKEFMKELPRTRRFSTAVEMEEAMKTMKSIKQGWVNIAEVDSIMRTMGLDLFPDELQQALKYATKKDDGTVCVKKILFGLTKTRRFSQAESDQGDMIDVQDVDSLLSNMGIQLTKEQLQDALEHVTVNGECA